MHEFFVAINAQLVRNDGNALMKDDQSELHTVSEKQVIRGKQSIMSQAVSMLQAFNNLNTQSEQLAKGQLKKLLVQLYVHFQNRNFFLIDNTLELQLHEYTHTPHTQTSSTPTHITHQFHRLPQQLVI